MASARASLMGVRLQVLLVITSPPVGETVNFFRESALQAFGTKTRKTRLRRFVFSFSRQSVSGTARAVSHKRMHESHCGLQKTPFYLHETGARVNKHFREYNDFSTICGMSEAFVNPYFRHAFVTLRPSPERDGAG
jgi:hypothetical protein